jgi:endoglucanase
MRKSSLLSLLFGILSGAQSLASLPGPRNCTTTFAPVSASVAFAALDPGWNLGNTLDATPDEGSWNNARVQGTTLSQIEARGFKSIRIPGIIRLYVLFSRHLTK